MKIKIEKTEKFNGKISAEIKSVEGKAQVRLLTSEMIIKVIESVEADLGIAKKYLDGIEIEYTQAQKFPSAYKYSADSTQFTAKRIGSHWYVTGIYRMACPNKNNNVSVKLTEESKKAIINKHQDYCLYGI